MVFVPILFQKFDQKPGGNFTKSARFPGGNFAKFDQKYGGKLSQLVIRRRYSKKLVT